MDDEGFLVSSWVRGSGEEGTNCKEESLVKGSWWGSMRIQWFLR